MRLDKIKDIRVGQLFQTQGELIHVITKTYFKSKTVVYDSYEINGKVKELNIHNSMKCFGFGDNDPIIGFLGITQEVSNDRSILINKEREEYEVNDILKYTHDNNLYIIHSIEDKGYTKEYALVGLDYKFGDRVIPVLQNAHTELLRSRFEKVGILNVNYEIK